MDSHDTTDRLDIGLDELASSAVQKAEPERSLKADEPEKIVPAQAEAVGRRVAEWAYIDMWGS